MRTRLRSERKQDALAGNAGLCSVAAAVVGSLGSAVIGGIASKNAANKAADAQQSAIDANAYQGQIATDQYNTYKSTYQPLEQQMVGDAKNYDTAANRNAAAATAQAGVSSELGKAQDRLSRTVGFDPSSAAGQAAETNLNLSGAAMGATAQNSARKQVQDTAYAHQLDMVGMGKGLVANASSGLANAANTASRIAGNEQALAGDQAKAAGMLAGNSISGLSKVNWRDFMNGNNDNNNNYNIGVGVNDTANNTNSILNGLL